MSIQLTVQKSFPAVVQWVRATAIATAVLISAFSVVAAEVSGEFQLRSVNIEEITSVGSGLSLGRKVKVTGTVTFVSPVDFSLFLYDRTGKIFVEGAPDPRVAVGTLVEAIGDVQPDGNSRKLSHCHYRVLGKGEPLIPKDATGDELGGGALDMEVVRLRGRLWTVPVSHANTLTLEVKVDRAFVSLLLLGNSGKSPLSQLRPGTLLETTGVCSMGAGKRGQSPLIRVYLRSEDEVRVLRGPPWWTWERIATALVLTAVLGVAAVGWLTVLRYQDRALALEAQREERGKAEEAVQRSERRYHELFNSMDEGFCVVQMLLDANGRPVDWRYLETNPAFERHSPLRGAVGKTIRELDSDIEPKWLETFDRVAITGEPARFVEFSQTSQRWLDLYAFRIGRPDEHKVAILFNDVTERKQAEEALRQAWDEAQARAREAERRGSILTAMMEHIPMGITIADAPDVRIRAVSRYGRELTGQPREQIEGIAVNTHVQRWRIFRKDGITPATNEELPLTRATQQGEIVREEEFVIERPDGRKVPILCTSAPIRDGDGRITGGVIGWQDITERKQNEDMLRAQHQRLELLNHTASGLLAVPAPENILRDIYQRLAVDLNADVYLLFLWDDVAETLRLHACGGVAPEAQSQLGFLGPSDSIHRLVVRERQTPCFADLQSSADPSHSLLKNLGIRACAWYPLLVANRILGAVCFASRHQDDFGNEDQAFFGTLSHQIALAMQRARLDEELRKYALGLEELVDTRTQKLRETIAELEHFSYTITHDMRAPLRAMQGFGELMLQDCGECLNPKRRIFLERIATAAKRMDRLILDALDYSKIVREEQKLEPVDAEALLRGMLETYPQFRAPGAHVEIVAPVPLVLANEAGLTQCFANFLSNAVKFVPPGQIAHVQVRADTQNGRVRLWFIDSGIGIPREYQEKIWVMFQRLNKTYDGTGIGLALVKKIVERMGGQVGVESEPEKGSRFWIELQEASRVPAAEPDTQPDCEDGPR